MIHYIYIICVFIFLFYFKQPLLAQDKYIDSLQNKLQSLSSDTAKVNVMNKMNSVWARNQHDLAIKKTRETIILAQKSQYVLGEMISFRILGMAYSKGRKQDSAFFYIKKAIELYPLTASQDWNKNNAKSNYSALGNIQINFGLDKEALNSYLTCLKLSEETHDTSRIASILNGIGIIHKSEGNLNKAKQYWTRAVEMAGHTPNLRLQASVNTNLGIAYLDSKEYKTALIYLEKSNALAIKEDGKSTKFALYNLGQANLGLQYHDKARSCFEQVLEIAVKDKDVIREILALKGLSEIASALQKWDLAIIWGIKAEERLSKSKDLSSAKKVYEVLFKAYQGARKYDKALDYHILLAEVKDSLFNLERIKEVNKLETEYEVEKKNAENTVLKQEQTLKDLHIKQQRWGIVSALCVICALLLLAAAILMGLWQTSKEKKKSDDLLLNILPSEVAQELKDDGKSIAKLYNHVSVMFTDFVGFTILSEQFTPQELVAEIDYCFKAYDAIIGKYGIEKIKTVGDAYIAVCGLPTENTQHAQIMVRVALEIQEFMASYKAERILQDRKYFQARIGIHSGAVVAGIVGVKKFAYDIWGDTVNTAARMEQNSEAGRVNLSGKSHELVKADFTCTYRGKVAAKNKGEIDMYFVEGISS